jgi:selenocysteine-specific elongation factor
MHTGAAEVIGRIKLLFDTSGLSAGHTCFALFTAEAPFAVAYHDTMIMRTYSPQSTIGSAIVLDTSPPTNPNKLAYYRAHLDDRLNGTPEEVLAACLASSPYGIGIDALVGRMRTPAEDVQTGLEGLMTLGAATNLGGRYYIHHSSLTALTNRIINTLRDYHENFPARQGMPREDLRAAAAKAMETKAFAALLANLLTQSAVVLEGPHVRLSEFKVTLSDRQHQLIESIYQEYERHGIVAPDANEVCKTVGVNRDTLLTLVQVGMLTGRFHRLGEAQFITDTAMNSALALVVERSQTTAGITVGELRDALEANRKAALQVLEYMDAKKMTRRVHERHVIFSHPPI